MLSQTLRNGSRNTRRSSPFLRNASSQPPVKRFRAYKTPLSLFWHRTVPIQLKYASAVLTSALTIVNVHPNVLITLGPPALFGGWLLNRYRNRAIYSSATEKIMPGKTSNLGPEGSVIRIAKYDETSIENVLGGIENEFDNFRVQVLEIVERRIADYVAHNQQKGRSLFMDENNQISVIVDEGDIETFVTLKYELVNFNKSPDQSVGSEEDADTVEYQLTNFNVFSVPFYSSRNKLERQRLGVIEVYLVQIPGEEGAKYEDYKILLEITPFKSFSKDKIVVDNLDGLYESRKYRHQNEKGESTLEEITIEPAK